MNENENENENENKNKISIVIPCYFNHVQFLFKLLEYYESQTVLPDEVIISISEMHRLAEPGRQEVEKIKEHEWNFSVKIYETTDKLRAGGNRNLGAEKATGDIIIFQDADDVPHYQRVEITKTIFDKYGDDINHFVHYYSKALHQMNQEHNLDNIVLQKYNFNSRIDAI